MLPVGEIGGDLEIRKDQEYSYCQVSQTLKTSEDSAWSVGAFPAYVGLGPGLCDPGLSPVVPKLQVTCGINEEFGWLENQRPELGGTIESKLPSLPNQLYRWRSQFHVFTQRVYWETICRGLLQAQKIHS